MASKRSSGGTEPGTRRRKRSLVSSVLVIAALAAALLITVRVGGKVCRPFLLCWQTHSDVTQIDAQTAAIDSENAQLLKRRERMRTTEGAVEKARTFGYMRPGEKAAILEEKPQSKPKDK